MFNVQFSMIVLKRFAKRNRQLKIIVITVRIASTDLKTFLKPNNFLKIINFRKPSITFFDG
jgi:hypothetical protein